MYNVNITIKQRKISKWAHFIMDMKTLKLS